jgi:hypothetical protein
MEMGKLVLAGAVALTLLYGRLMVVL